MKSWREGVPQQVQDEMDAMLDHGIRLGISLLVNLLLVFWLLFLPR